MNKFLSIFLLTNVMSCNIFAQLSDDFSDGDFTANPSWTGSTAQFMIDASHQLQLNNSAAGTSYLSTPSPAVIDDAQWNFYVKQTFSPSASNYSRVYLASDQQDLTGPLNGYYLQFGEAGSNDAIELFKQTGTTKTSICRGPNGTIAASFQVRVKVLKTPSGDWELYTDYAGGINFLLEASVKDQTYTTSAFMGIECVYTSTNSKKFFYDDFVMNAKAVDNTPPVLQSVTIKSNTQLELVFSEIIEQASAETITNYTADHNLNNPQSAILQLDNRTILLTYSTPFPNGVDCSLSVAAIKDVADNSMVTTAKPFRFFQANPTLYKDIILTEIFPDPTPQVGLPQVEFVEIFNRSVNPIDITGWQFTDGSSIGKFPSLIIFPGDYKIISSSSDVNQFTTYGSVIGLSTFPTLNNSGDALVLKTAAGVMIDSVKYSDTWYHDIDKKEGGWSLELIDPTNLCSEAANWTAAEDASGGTPGKQNSIYADKPDVTGPKLLAAFPSASNTVQLTLDEKLNKKLPALSSIILTPSDEVESIQFADASLTNLNIVLKQDLLKRALYTIEINDVYDCPGNTIQPEFNKLDFALPEEADSADLIVNEILFNPKPTGVDFVEFYNRSDKYINLKNFSIATLENGVVKNASAITTTDYLLKPQAYIVFTENKTIIKSEYPQAADDNIFEVKNLPSFNDDEGSIALVNETANLIDAFTYTKDMHSKFIKDVEGVSLERIAFNEPTNETQNWKSASSTIGFATPGYINSNSRPESNIASESIQVQPEVFIPVYGQPDFTQINYNFEQGGYVANVKIYDAEGRKIKHLANNEVLGTEGFFRWDGDHDNGTKARVGYYIVWFEVFDTAGTLKTFQKKIVVATRF